MSVVTLFECESADTVESVYEELEYVLILFEWYHMTVLFGKFCSGIWERIFLLVDILD